MTTILRSNYLSNMLTNYTLKNMPPFYENGVAFNDLQKVNFVYGINGSGKTTITKYLADAENPLYSDCSLNWKAGMPMQVLVYNKDFREKNFGKGSLPGVFTLGQASKEEQEAIESLKKQLDEMGNNITGKNQTLQNLLEEKRQSENDGEEWFWVNIYKKNEVFKEAFLGSINSKRNFKLKLLQEFTSNQAPLLELDQLMQQAKTIFGEKPQNLPLLPLMNQQILLDETETNEIWKKKIIGKSDVPIGRLIQHLNMNDWVHEGRQFLQEGEDTCPFCQKPTASDNFKEQLESYFDQTFMTDTGLVTRLAESYITNCQDLLNQLESLEGMERANPNTKLEIENFSAALKTLRPMFISNRQSIQAKTKEPSRSMDLISTRDQLGKLQQYILDANQHIKKHNTIVANYATERSKLVSAIWKFVTETNKIEIEAYQKKIANLSKGLNSLEDQIKKLKDDYKVLHLEIQVKTQNLTSVQPSIDEINRILKSYGFLNFIIVPLEADPHQYQILRQDGTIAESTLSEGETTFITFLYFLQLCKGSTNKDSITANRILVIDDPISSLDSNILFVVSSLLKEMIKKIKTGEGQIRQLILLTHNVYFHKEVSYVSNKKTEKKRGEAAHFWMLRKKGLVSTVEAYHDNNPIQNSYELLWKDLRTNAETSMTTIQNTMRRIIENYFKILGRMDYDDIIKTFPNAEEQEICRSMFCWINDGSHCFPDDLFIEHQQDHIEKYRKVFRNIFVYTRHLAHYNMMMQIEEMEEEVIQEVAA